MSENGGEQRMGRRKIMEKFQKGESERAVSTQGPTAAAVPAAPAHRRVLAHCSTALIPAGKFSPVPR